jgi:ABC-type cobalamin/Fe3+-siderophores transport system ATPase subunit
VVSDWNRLITEREKIFEPRETFLRIINSLMQRKEFTINAQNELVVKTQSGKELPLNLLSSGEKQLLIVLGEALLQEKATWVYIADEPEISLHITWQEQLIDNLLAINPSAQIVFATHSPDLVGRYSNRTFDMEKVFK